jgi:hypothetical protein
MNVCVIVTDYIVLLRSFRLNGITFINVFGTLDFPVIREEKFFT